MSRDRVSRDRHVAGIFVAPIDGKIIHKEYINTQKVTNAPNLIIQSEPPASKVIIVDRKVQTDIYLFSGGTGASATPGKRIPRKKRKMKSLSMSPIILYINN